MASIIILTSSLALVLSSEVAHNQRERATGNPVDPLCALSNVYTLSCTSVYLPGFLSYVLWWFMESWVLVLPPTQTVNDYPEFPSKCTLAVLRFHG